MDTLKNIVVLYRLLCQYPKYVDEMCHPLRKKVTLEPPICFCELLFQYHPDKYEHV
jgi:hypothetical protein